MTIKVKLTDEEMRDIVNEYRDGMEGKFEESVDICAHLIEQFKAEAVGWQERAMRAAKLIAEYKELHGYQADQHKKAKNWRMPRQPKLHPSAMSIIKRSFRHQGTMETHVFNAKWQLAAASSGKNLQHTRKNLGTYPKDV